MTLLAEVSDRPERCFIPAATVCFLRRDGKVLLQERAAGRIWAGRWNGPGGKVNPGESPRQAIIREVAEETGLQVIDVRPHGTLDLVCGVPERSRLRVFVFCSEAFAGRARGGPEGRLRWCGEERLPFSRLWPDMRYWLPLVLAGGAVDGVVVYDDAGDRLLSTSLRVELPGRQDSPGTMPAAVLAEGAANEEKRGDGRNTN